LKPVYASQNLDSGVSLTLSSLLTGEEPSPFFRTLKIALLSGSLTLEAPPIGLHCEKHYISV